jgi:hypothetical protein
MKRLTVTFLALAALAGAAMAQDSCRVLVWDNDAGECEQLWPDACMDSTRKMYVVWTDSRDGERDIYGQMFTRTLAQVGTNFLVNAARMDKREQRNPAIACSSGGNFVAVWQDSNTTGNYYWNIIGRLFDNNATPLTDEFQVNRNNAAVRTYPKVARNHRSGKFVVVWQEMRGSSYPYAIDIYARLFRSNGVPLTDTIRINVDTAQNQVYPSVAFTDSGILFAWQDYFYGPTFNNIMSRSFDTTMSNPSPVVQVDNHPGIYCLHYTPSVAGSDSGFYTVAWSDRRAGGSRYDIYAQKFLKSGNPSGPNVLISTTTLPNRDPSVAMSKGRDYFVSWSEYNTTQGREVYARYSDFRGILDDVKQVNHFTDSSQSDPASCGYRGYYATYWRDFYRVDGKGDVMGQLYRVVTGTTFDSVTAVGENVRADYLKPSGRRVYYRLPDYDNPATVWNENPRLSTVPESTKVSLDTSYVLSILSRNVYPLSFFRVKDTDTLKGGRQKKGLNGEVYEACVMDLGYATDTRTAGAIDSTQMDSLERFVDDGGALICSGNDFGEMYGASDLFQRFGAVYDGPGNSSTVGNIDSLVGQAGTFTAGMDFDYPFQGAADNSVDRIHAGSYMGTAGDTVFMSGGPADWAYSRGISYSAFWKDPKAAEHRNVYLPFTMGALLSDGRHPNTQTELTRRILGFQNFNVEPAPISDLTADTTTSTTEGTVTLRWNAVSDDALTERATKYLLKIREYDPARIDSGKFTSEKACVDSGFAYYQAWVPATVGGSESKTVYLAPGKSYVFALKAGDESTPTRWSALGAEPMSQTRGDTLTYHFITMGSTAGLGSANPFSVSEQINVRNSDTLLVTWSSTSIFFGYARMDWRTGGDLFFYLDTKTGGADSTMTDWNDANVDTASAFDVAGDFKPDFCLAIDSLGSRSKLMYWNGTAWAESIGTYPASYLSLDTINDTYTTVARVMRNKIGNPTTLKLLALHLREYDDYCYRSFPINNPIYGGKDAKWISRYPYYYYFSSLALGLSPRNVAQALSVELAELSALESGSGVTLSWRTESETDNYQWLIDRSLEPDANYQRIATVPGQGSSPTGHSYSYTDNAVHPGMTYYYLLGDQDFMENVTWHGPVSVTAAGPVIDRVRLLPCRPNPARGRVTMGYELPSACRASLRIYDICGRLVRTLADGDHQAGRHAADWDGKSPDGTAVRSGVYFYRMEAGSACLTGKITLIR